MHKQQCLCRFKYLRYEVNYESEAEIKDRTNKFMNICGTIDRNPRNKTRQSTRINVYKTIAIFTLTYTSEVCVMRQCSKYGGGSTAKSGEEIESHWEEEMLSLIHI